MSVNSKMTAIADAIRSKTGGTDVLTLDEMATAISGIEVSREPELQEKTVAPSTNSQTVTPDSGYDGLSKVTVNAMPTATQATPSITVNSSGLITASATQTAGYVAAGTKSGTKQLTTQAAKTITPSTSSQTAVASGMYTTGAVTVAAIPSNYIIPSGTKTITTNGTHDVKNYASATVNVAGEDVTSETNAYTNKLATLETAITQLETELQGKASGGGSGGGNIETCTVTIVHPWGGNNDPELCQVYVHAYDIETGSVIREEMCSDFDFEPEHSVTFKTYKNCPINIALRSIKYSDILSGITITASGGSILDAMEFPYFGSVLCMPTSDNATFTFASN